MSPGTVPSQARGLRMAAPVRSSPRRCLREGEELVEMRLRKSSVLPMAVLVRWLGLVAGQDTGARSGTAGLQTLTH